MTFRLQSRRGERAKVCQCEHYAMHHRPKGGGCYACSCESFVPGINQSHRFGHAHLRAKRTEYNGRWYRSGEEARFAGQLDLRIKAIDGDVERWEYETSVEIRFNGIFILSWRPDFHVYLRDGRLQIVEIKGYMANTPEFKLKWRLTEALYANDPNVDLLLIAV